MAASKAQLPYNPRVLHWARERAVLDVREVAEKLKVSEQKIRDWEAGTSTPTVRQGRRLAALYDLHFLEFFSDEIPEVQPIKLAPDYRAAKIQGEQGPKEKRKLEKIQEWAEEQRLNALSLIEALDETVPAFPEHLRSHIEIDVERAAESSREAMGLNIEAQLSFTKAERQRFPSILRDKIESLGVLVLKRSDITDLAVRGICFFAIPLPIIVFGKESPGAQAFTLAHELGHVLLGNSAVSGPPSLGGKSDHHAIEDWCNRFASAFLAPRTALSAMFPKPNSAAPDIEPSLLSDLAEKFAMSRHAMLIRLINLGYVQSQFYWKTMRPRFLQEEREYESFGRPKYYGKRYINRKGNYYTGLVMSAWSSGQIGAHNAVEYMGIKHFKHIQQIREDYGF